MKKLLSVLLSAFMTANLAIFTSFAQSTDIEITSLEALPEKQWGYVEDVAVPAPAAVATNTNVENLTLTPVWSGVDGFTFGDKPEGNSLVAYTATYTAPDGYVFADALAAATENTTLSADKKVLTYKFYTYVIPSDAIYIDDTGSDSTDDYAEGNLSHPYKTLPYAMKLLESKGGGTIVIVDKLTLDSSYNGVNAGTRLSKDADYTIMGWDKDSTLETNCNYHLCGNTTFRDLNLSMLKSSAGIYGRGYNLTMGDKHYTDIIVKPATASCAQLFMTGDGLMKNTTAYDNPGKLTINSGEWYFVCSSGYNQTVVNGDVEFEINGGIIRNMNLGLHGGNVLKLHSITGDIKCTVNGGEIGTLCLNSSGANYTHTGNADVIMNGGTVQKITFARGIQTTTNKSIPDADSNATYVENEGWTDESKRYTLTVTPKFIGDYSLTINGGTVTSSITNDPSDIIQGKTTVDLLGYDGDKDALLSKIKSSQFDVVKAQIIYVDAENGDDTYDGTSTEKPLKTMTAALKKFASNVSGKIYICGEYGAKAHGFTDTKGRGEVTIAGYDENALFLFGGPNIDMFGSTIIENLKINVIEAYDTIRMGGNKLVMGEGIEMVTDERSAGLLQISGGTDGVHSIPMESVDVTINSGTYGTISAVGTLYGKSVTGDVNFTINGGTFKEGVYMGSYCKPSVMTAPLDDNNSGKIGGTLNVTINGGTFTRELALGGKQPGTIGAINAKINGGTFAGAITVGPMLAPYDKDTDDGTTFKDGNEYSFTTEVLGDAILEINGGNITGKISRTENTVKGKSVVLLSNGTAASVQSERFDYVVNIAKKGEAHYDAENDAFEIIPDNAALAIFVNDTELANSEDNLYTLSGGTNNVYNITFGGETDISEKFVITPPIAELTPVSEIVLTGGKNVYNPLTSCTASSVTWEPADAKFRFDTQYTATVVLTAKDGIEYSDDFSGLNINGNYAGNTVDCTLSEDKSTLTVKVTFPKTAKSDLDLLAQENVNAKVIFTTKRDEDAATNLHETMVTLTNANDPSLVYSGVATENGASGEYTAEIPGGIYNITVKKQGYLEAKLESVMLSSDSSTVDMGALIGGDIIDENGDINGDGIIDIDDFTIILRSFAMNASDEVLDAANISESENVNVSQLGFVKSGFGKTSENNCSDYDGYFENTYYRLTVDKELNVGYIGGSIIQGASPEGTQTYSSGGFVSAGNEKFIDRMQSNFQKNFPDAKIYSINAGISDTGSSFGLFRLAEDMMLREEGHIPDLVFLEFCVNDFASIGLETIELQYESVINAVYKINPKADIVCMLTAMSGYDVPKKAHINVANHYNIPIVDVGAALRADYDIAGDCKVFTNDNLHPNGAGYEYYTKLCWNLLEKYIVYAAPASPKYRAKVLPEQYKSGVITNPAKLPVTDEAVVLSEGSSWKVETNKVMSRIFDAETKKIPCITSSTAGDAFAFKFTGDAFGFIIKQSPKMGSFEYSVDGGEWVEFRSSKSYTHYQTYLMETNLENKEHTVTVRVTGTGIGTEAGCEVGIAGILYNDLSK